MLLEKVSTIPQCDFGCFFYSKQTNVNKVAISFVGIGNWKVAWMIELSSADWKISNQNKSVAGDSHWYFLK